MKVLETNNIGMKYGTKKALDNISVSIEKGQIFGLVGKNGAGKTTLMKIILGLIPQYEGELKLFESGDLKKMRRNIGALIETPAFFENMTGYQNLNYYRILYGLDKSIDLDALLKDVKLDMARNKKFKAYSLGMKQRLGIALALMGNPEFMVLDEPINGIDPEGIVEIRRLLKSLSSKGTTILISSHILSELENLCDEICIIDDGKLVDVLETENNNISKYHTIIKTDNDDAFDKILGKFNLKRDNKGVVIGEFDINDILKEIYSNGLNVIELQRRKDNLEEYYLGRIEGGK